LTEKKNHRGVYENPKGSGVWWIHYYDAASRRHREKIGAFQSAVDAYLDRKLQIRNGSFVAPGRKDKVSFIDLLDAALAAKKGRVSERSYSVDVDRSKLLREAFGKLRAQDVTPELIEEEFQKLRDRGLSGSTINRYRSLLSSVFSFAVKKRKFPANPVRSVDRYPENDPRVRWLDDGEEAALRKVMREGGAYLRGKDRVVCAPCRHNEARLDLALNTGMRRGEQFGCKWDQVDLERNILTIYGKRKPDGRRRRFIPLNSAARAALVELHSQSAGSRFVIPDARREGQADWTRWFEDCVKAAGIENFRWHDLRHTFASRLAMKGVPIPQIQQLLGHTNITQTMKYAHLSPGHLRDAVDALNIRPEGTATKRPLVAGERSRKKR
jgi:integrase